MLHRVGVPELPPPSAGDVHVWLVSPVASGAEIETLAADLSSYERGRVQGMTRREDRDAFVAGRARVRQVLSRYVGLPPYELDVVSRVDGKPALAGAPAWFDFSFSRCAGLHVCVVAVNRRVGVDVEMLAARPDAALWTRRQALAKAAGLDRGAAIGLITVPPGSDGEVMLEAYGTRSWLVRSFAPSAGIVGAVAAAGEWHMTLRHYPESDALSQ